MADDHEVGEKCDEETLDEMNRIRALFVPSVGDAEDLITYAKNIVALRKAADVGRPVPSHGSGPDAWRNARGET